MGNPAGLSAKATYDCIRTLTFSRGAFHMSTMNFLVSKIELVDVTLTPAMTARAQAGAEARVCLYFLA